MSQPSQNRLPAVADVLLRQRWPLLLFAVILTGLAVYPASQLSFEQSIEALYRKDDPRLLAYQRSKRLFGGDEFVVVAYADPDVRSAEGLARIRRFSDKLSDVPGVMPESTQNLAELLAPAEMPFLLRLLLRLRHAAMIELARGVLIGDEGETTAIVLRLKPAEQASVPRGETIRRIRDLAGEHNPPAYVVGEPVQVHDLFRYVEQDGDLLFRISLVLLSGVIFLLLRSLRWVVLPLIVVVGAIVWTEALLVLTGIELSMVSSMLNSLMTIIGVATVMHVAVHYRDLRAEFDRIGALKQTFVELAPAIFWTCTTTAAGFAALLSSQITPVRSFGTMMSIGALLVLAAAVTFLPGGVLLRSAGTRAPQQTRTERALVAALERFTLWVTRHARPIGVVTVLFVAFSAAGLFRLEIETDFSKNFRESSPIVQSLNFVESRLGGAGIWEVNFAAPDPLTPHYLDRVRELAENLRDLRDEEGLALTKVVAITDLLDVVPGSSDSVETIRDKLDQIATFQPEFEPSLYNAEASRMRIVLRARERQRSEDKVRLISRVQEVAEKEFPGARTTGVFVLLTFIIESLLRDQLVSFLLATVGIGLMMTFAFRSVAFGLISLVPNLFPIVMLVGTLGWVGLPVNIGTAMIASVSMGLTVDASIHYLSGYRRARRAENSVIDALRETHGSVGRAVVFATFALIVGFSVLTVSHFIPLVYFGILVSVAMLGGLIGDLILLPILLQWLDRRRRTP